MAKQGRIGPSRWMPVAAMAGVMLAVLGWWARPAQTQPPEQQVASDIAGVDMGPTVRDPQAREKLVVPFARGLWVPTGTGPVTLSDAEMGVVGVAEMLRVYAPRGGGGGERPGGWQAGEVYLRVGPNLYWPLAPRTRTAPPGEQRKPAARPAPMPAP